MPFSTSNTVKHLLHVCLSRNVLTDCLRRKKMMGPLVAAMRRVITLQVTRCTVSEYRSWWSSRCSAVTMTMVSFAIFSLTLEICMMTGRSRSSLQLFVPSGICTADYGRRVLFGGRVEGLLKMMTGLPFPIKCVSNISKYYYMNILLFQVPSEIYYYYYHYYIITCK